MISELCNICEGIMITNILDCNQVLALIDYKCSVIIFSFFCVSFFLSFSVLFVLLYKMWCMANVFSMYYEYE